MNASRMAAAKLFLSYQPVFDALGNPMRQKIMFTLAEAAERGTPLSVHELALQTTLARPTISHHIKILRAANLVEPAKIGTQIFYTPKFETSLQMAQEFTLVLQDYGLKKERK